MSQLPSNNNTKFSWIAMTRIAILMFILGTLDDKFVEYKFAHIPQE